MSSKESTPPADKFEELEMLLLASLEESFPEAERERLNTILRESPEARAFASGVLFDDALLTDSLSTEAAEVVFKSQAAKTTKSSRKSPSSTWLRIAALFAMVLFPLVWLMQRDDTVAPGDPVARIQVANRGTGLESGRTYFVNERIDIEKGRAVFLFASGAKLSVKGPASFTFTGTNSANLERGRGTVRVPGKVKGFTITTPSERVVDLGTSFGVEVEESGATSIAVFEGEVELRGDQHRTGPQLLLAGASVRVADRNQAPSEIPYQIHDYLDTWQHSFGIDAIEGDLRIAHPGERQNPGAVVDADHLLVFPELESVHLPAGFRLSATAPGIFSDEEEPRASRREVTLPAPLKADSHLLQFNPGGASGHEARHFTGLLRFDRPIVGLLLGETMLDESDDLLALPTSNFENLVHRGINIDDRVELAPDRRTLYLSLDVQNGIDQIRVLVASDHDQTPGQPRLISNDEPGI